ncbi:type II 3-dehydroquinate dehydratase [Oricola cellulosilytica]|uniref:3-dehydroquinate dehydratase n=1 Tax=Oricola cellulosilytica TaxID=1429082 RepID=A0A4V2MNT5_9HYPH|nr:type II 3-dehydroquinate dehydratase [Oricola cellulosilytica]TCD14507.1 type II 3-dehydroquinate dehydratase [Oricola cellulosilytica]
MKKRILILNGPNLNMLGTREPSVYGAMTLADIDAECTKLGSELGLVVASFQSNHEGELVEKLQEAGREKIGVVFNPGAYSHTSIALRDAIASSKAMVVEVHISNIHAREPFRHHSYISAVAKGVICGLGTQGYLLAMRALAVHMNPDGEKPIEDNNG